MVTREIIYEITPIETQPIDSRQPESNPPEQFRFLASTDNEAEIVVAASPQKALLEIGSRRWLYRGQHLIVGLLGL